MAEATLAVDAPAGAHFQFEEVKTNRGTQSLGEVPILVWDDVDQMREHYGDEGLLAVCDGTSLRVSFQNIARRFKQAGKSDEEIAKAEIDFRPGKRQVGASTPATRAARSAKAAVEKGADADQIAKLMEKIASGELSNDDIAALVG